MPTSIQHVATLPCEKMTPTEGPAAESEENVTRTVDKLTLNQNQSQTHRQFSRHGTDHTPES